jgi:hypothetical protein
VRYPTEAAWRQGRPPVATDAAAVSIDLDRRGSVAGARQQLLVTVVDDPVAFTRGRESLRN